VRYRRVPDRASGIISDEEFRNPQLSHREFSEQAVDGLCATGDFSTLDGHFLLVLLVPFYELLDEFRDIAQRGAYGITEAAQAGRERAAGTGHGKWTARRRISDAVEVTDFGRRGGLAGLY
jgi:hypothetical protein